MHAIDLNAVIENAGFSQEPYLKRMSRQRLAVMSLLQPPSRVTPKITEGLRLGMPLEPGNETEDDAKVVGESMSFRLRN